MIERIPITDREEWLGWRKSNVNASEVGAIFGAHPYQTMAGLHAAKCGGLDLPGPDPESAVIRRGNALEPIVGKQVGLQRPEWDIVKADEYLRDPALKLGCTPDFWINGDPRGRGVLQTKTVGSGAFKRHWGGAAEPSPPVSTILQVATEMMLADAAFGAIGVLVVGDYEFSTYVIDIERNHKAEHRIRVAVYAFWEAIRIGEIPELDYERDGELLKLMHPHETPGKVIDLRGDNRIQELCEIREANAGVIKIAEKARSAAETEIRAKLGDAEIAVVPGWRVSLKTQTRREHVVPAASFRALRTRREEEQSDAADND